MSESRADVSIWWFAFGYFACYAPYSALTKALSKGWFSGMDRPLGGFEMLPLSVLSSMVAMVVFLTVMGWWKHAGRIQLGPFNLPGPSRWTALSGVCTACIVMTTTLSYTFSGVSIVFVMLLMRGGVLIIAPVVDRLTGRHVQWYSWVGLALSMSALLVAFSESSGYKITLVCALDVTVYLASYFLRLRFMSRQAKSKESNANVRYFVEEQMVATPLSFMFLVLMAALGATEEMVEVRSGFALLGNLTVGAPVLLVGLLSQGTGVFGGLILLDKRENTFCVPVNRASSILAGVVATYSLKAAFGKGSPSWTELAGAGLIVAAIGMLTLPELWRKRKAAQAR